MRFTKKLASFAVLTLMAGGLNLGCSGDESQENEEEGTLTPEAHYSTGVSGSASATGAGVGTGEMTGTGAGRVSSNMSVSGLGMDAKNPDGAEKKKMAPTTAPATHPSGPAEPAH